MPLLSPEEETELSNYVAAEGSTDTEAIALLAKHRGSVAPQPAAQMPKASQFKAPAFSEQPNQKRAQDPSPAEPDYPLTGGGAAIGGMVGSTLGSAFGPMGRAAGATAGGFLGGVSQQVAQSGRGDDIFRSWDNKMPNRIPVDAAGAAKAGALQGGISLGSDAVLRPLGALLQKTGIPPAISAFLKSVSPRQAVLDAAPQAAKDMATTQGGQDALSAIQSAGGGAAQQTLAGARARLASKQLPTAINADAAKQQFPKIQAALAQGKTDLAPLNKNLGDAVTDAMSSTPGSTMTPDAINAAVRSGKMTSAEAAQRLITMSMSKGGPGPDLVTQAFRDTSSFPQTAGSSAVAQAAVPVLAAGAKQTQNAMTLGGAQSAASAADALGLPGQGALASQQAGQQALSNLGLKIPLPKRFGSIPVIDGGRRTAQTVSALMGDASAAPISNAAPAVGGSTAALSLTDLLSQILQNRSTK